MKTTVEWLEHMLSIILNEEQLKEIAFSIEQAKEMEKQQIIDFTNDFIDKHTFGDYDGLVQRNKTIKEYYKETFNK